EDAGPAPGSTRTRLSPAPGSVRSEGDLLVGVGGGPQPGRRWGWLGRLGRLGLGGWLEAAGRVLAGRGFLGAFVLELAVDVVLAERAGTGVGQVVQLQRGRALVAQAERAGPDHLSGRSLPHGPAALVAQHMVMPARGGEAGVGGRAAAGMLDDMIRVSP